MKSGPITIPLAQHDHSVKSEEEATRRPPPSFAEKVSAVYYGESPALWLMIGLFLVLAIVFSAVAS